MINDMGSKVKSGRKSHATHLDSSTRTPIIKSWTRYEAFKRDSGLTVVCLVFDYYEKSLLHIPSSSFFASLDRQSVS